VPKRVAETGLHDHLTSQGVSLAGGHSGSELLQCPALRCLDQVVHGPLAIIRPRTDNRRSGEIGTIAIHLRPEVDQEELSPEEDPSTGPGMGQRRPRPGGHDRGEWMPLTPSSPQRRLEHRGDLEFGLTGTHLRQNFRKRLLGQLGCSADGGNLRWIFGCSQALDQLRRRHDPARGQTAESLCITHWKRVRFYSQSRIGLAGQYAAQPVPDATLIDLHTRRISDFRRCLRGITEIGDQRCAVALNQEESR
jgi:hypothetical protein